MKVAIVHDWLVVYAGAEQLLQHIVELFPDADLFAVIDFLKADDRRKLLGKRAKTTFLQKFPAVSSKYQYYLGLMPLAIEQLDLTEYDLVISSSHAVAKGVITHPHQTHICYTHTPLRYAWDLQFSYLKSLQGIRLWLAKLMMQRMRNWDVISANRVDHFIANSHFVARRIQKCYRRDSTVIFNGIEVDRFPLYKDKEDFYVTVSRLVSYKRVDLLVETFAKLPNKQLVVIGDGPELAKIQKAASPNVKILGYQSDEKMIEYLKRAKCFLFASKEDWGRAPVEAQCCGTPVIAYSAGGGGETVTEKTGVLFEEQTVESIVEAIERFDSKVFCPKECQENGHKYSVERFKREFGAFIQSKVGSMYESSSTSGR
ncbi:MAG: hypothetical protein S4CHLAM81_01830 [Chlamydiales bacterium]|nr:hypothetical protein [Chlamydiales bacterium]MCH9634977.1 hypothetical protein [Chlamydiales bacterium]MCH9704461.1 glycosyltransferase [Chlamydiota bacterium]